MSSGEQLATRATFDSKRSSSQYSVSAASFFADGYFVDKSGLAELCTHGFAVVCTDGCPALEELVSDGATRKDLENRRPRCQKGTVASSVFARPNFIEVLAAVLVPGNRSGKNVHLFADNRPICFILR